VSRLHQQTAQIDVACFRYSMLRVRVSGLALSRTQAEERACLAAVLDRIGAVEREHVGCGDQWSDAGNSAQSVDLRVPFGQLLDAAIHLPDAGVECGDLVQQRACRLGQCRGIEASTRS